MVPIQHWWIQRRSPFPDRLLQNLRFLQQIGVLTQASYQDLQAAVPDLIPKHVWVGYDYTDPVLKNFILRTENERICVVDVDGLAGNQLLGTGVAKACVRWLGPYRSLFFSSLAQQGAPDIQAYFSFVELYFLAKWMKRAYLEHDWKVIDSTLFERFRHPHESSNNSVGLSYFRSSRRLYCFSQSRVVEEAHMPDFYGFIQRACQVWNIMIVHSDRVLS